MIDDPHCGHVTATVQVHINNGRTYFYYCLYLTMGFCRRCGDIVSGERCKCGGVAVAPVVSWRDLDAENHDRWTRTYVSRERSASVSASQAKRLTKGAVAISSLNLSNRVSAAVAPTESRPTPPLRPTTTGPVPEAGILPSPCDSTLSKVYGSVLQPKESLATFSCLICSTVFPPDATIYPDPRSPDATSENRFLCRPCFIINGGSKGTCPTCTRPVLTLKSEGSFIHASDKYWHKRCFNCNECQRNIGDTPLVDLLGRPSCEECFDSCLRRDRGREQEPNTPMKKVSSPRHSPTTRRNIGGIDTSSTMHNLGLNSREASPALDELEQRLGIVRSLRGGSPSLEELSQRLSSIGKEPPRARRDSRHSERYRSPEPEDAFSSSPERTVALRQSETSSPVRKQVTGMDGACSPAPTPEAIEEMKSRFMRTTVSPPSIPPSPLNNLAQSFSTGARTSTRTSLGSRIPVASQTQSDAEVQMHGDEYALIENSAGTPLIPPPSPSIRMTPDLVLDTSNDTARSSVSGVESPPCEPQHEERRHNSAAEETRRPAYRGDYKDKFSLDATMVVKEETEGELVFPIHMPSKRLETKQTPSKIPVASKSSNVTATIDGTTFSTKKPVNDEPTSIARCAKCEELLFSTKGGGRYLTLPAEEGAKSKMYHVECFRCTTCDGPFKEGDKGQAIFVKAKGGPCHIEVCASCYSINSFRMIVSVCHT
ncbi:hypothetical protein AX15_007168 [Amanita polypyramis BW_CC]|nr:hypothetical protein AX15_007168 [Amanita polypyramis BW_CC]